MNIPHQLLNANGREIYVGPWPCEKCKELSQYAVVTSKKNRVFCRNESCGFNRLIDKRNHIIVEADGTTWAFDGAGNKWRVRGR